MTSYPAAPVPPTPAKPVRPGTLAAALGAAVVAGLLAVVDGIVMLVGASDIALDIAAKALAQVTGQPVEEAKAGLNAEPGLLDDVVGTLHTRAYVLVVFGAALVLFGLLMRGAAVWARVLVTLSALPAVGMALRVVTDDGTGLLRGLAGAALAVGVVAIVLAWLPANGRYAKEVKASKAIQAS
ncbi:hypothetical protein ORV05_02805 [Amycolatopsis cynarae]|uniref:DUF2127 domain-containing protein n=1 Tax=Amycolatopsis cynarae TaxID=2995223 RepID=A0ABY7B499_9PSEU|nr:hypothetical protein [Amycolatopsis sp. HUAS 11-8]WAL66762.1 hypothetical protein ORV05_02805 [Amycolatopsis sp. HUAS 11-8]